MLWVLTGVLAQMSSVGQGAWSVTNRVRGPRLFGPGRGLAVAREDEQVGGRACVQDFRLDAASPRERLCGAPEPGLCRA